jgi:hypothetical protein
MTSTTYMYDARRCSCQYFTSFTILLTPWFKENMSIAYIDQLYNDYIDQMYADYIDQVYADYIGPVYTDYIDQVYIDYIGSFTILLTPWFKENMSIAIYYTANVYLAYDNLQSFEYGEENTIWTCSINPVCISDIFSLRVRYIRSILVHIIGIHLADNWNKKNKQTGTYKTFPTSYM